jgi:hypothetical protein
VRVVVDPGAVSRIAALPMLVLVTALGLALPAGASALTVGLGEQQPAAYADPRLRALRLGAARIVVPWDAATSEPAAVQAQLDAVAAAGMQPHVAFEHRRGERCPSSPCAAPSTAQYRAAVAAFHARFPQVRTFTTWNEANHQSQPVAARPEAVAAYYAQLTTVCSACTVVAGDVLDSGSYVRWLQRFRAAATGNPRLWGLHDYGDVTYGTTAGADAVLAAVPGALWIEETGGIVTLRNAAGRETLPASESRAAAAIDRAFALARTRPRIGRMYVYQWQATAGDRFDAGLTRPDGSLRPSYARLVADLAALPAATPAAPARLTWTAGWSKLRPGRLVVRATCRVPGHRCRGIAVITLRGHRLASRVYRTTAAHPTQTLRLTVSRAIRARVRAAARRPLTLSVRPALPAGARTTTVLALPRPA